MKNLHKHFCICLLAFNVIIYTPQISNALVYPFNLTLSGANENPPNASPGTGNITGTYDDVTNALTFNLTFSGLLGTTTASHFHAPAGLTTNATVRIGFAGFPTGVTSGTYGNSYILTAQQEGWLLTDSMYVNVHSSLFAPGELRRQMILDEPIPVATQIKLVIQGFHNLGTGMLNMRDTVRAYLRNSTTPFAVVDSAKSIIDSVTFSGSFLFANALSGTYYIQTRHRNALETWSKTGGESYTRGLLMNYDFTTGASQAYLSNMIMTGTIWGLYEGDVTQEGVVDLSDVLLNYNAATAFETGYINTDVNGDSIADLSDQLIAYNNSAAFVTKKTP